MRLSPFSITTPVIEGKSRRKPRGGKRPYTLMPDRFEPVDARHLLARYGRLSRVLLRADVLAERLAGRALTLVPHTSDRAGAASLSSEARRNAGEQNNKPNPLYLSSLHSILAPEDLWASAKELEDERGDLTSLHLMASEGLSAAGFPPGPDPRLRLPEFERWKPPEPPCIRLI